jgi:hypothetical protein
MLGHLAERPFSKTSNAMSSRPYPWIVDNIWRNLGGEGCTELNRWHKEIYA